MNLIGKQLKVVNIHRKGIFDMDAMVFCCDNCGRAIVNSATVETPEGEKYVIGLDCKKTLIDKPIIDKILILNDPFTSKYKVKEYKRDQNDIVNVLKYIDNSARYETVSDNQYLTVYDNQQMDSFGNFGKTIYNESLGYLFKIGLKDVLQSAVNKGIIKRG